MMQNPLHLTRRGQLSFFLATNIASAYYAGVLAKSFASPKGSSHMTLSASLLRQLKNPSLNINQRAQLRCRSARELENSGRYEDARQALGELWQRIGDRPQIEELERGTAAEVLLRAGVLTSWIGGKQQITDAQETAKNLISESASVFESVGHIKRMLEAQTELAVCYWREGGYDEGRAILKGVLSRLHSESELKAKAVMRLAIVERSAERYREALNILTSSAGLFDKINNHTVRGGFHNVLAGTLEDLGTSERRADYIDRAFVEYSAASFHFEQAHHKHYRANVENNLGFLYFKAGRYKEAHEHLNYARRLLMYLKATSTVAQVNETRARVFLAEGNYPEAERVARAAVCTLEKGDQQALLAEALISHGTALARLGYHAQARATFQRAVGVAQLAGAINRAGEAALKLVHELGENLLGNHAKPIPTTDALGDEVRRYEYDLIKEALISSRGRVTQAARLLGISYQHLCYIIDNRQTDLLKFRTPKKQRPKQRQ
jgi:tetratricopeptide (TPR) repeat protein